MTKKLKKILKIAGFSLLWLITVFIILMLTGVIWKSPAYFKVGESKEFEKPVMSMQEYAIAGKHVRPYVYHLKGEKGAVYVVGIDHTKEVNDPQIDSIDKIWQEFKPDVVLVEGRLGFLFSWFQDPVKSYGESGKTISLAKKDRVDFYTWEPEKQDEVNLMLKKFSPEKVAFFYSLRPYLSNFRYGKPEDPDKAMQGYINSRTDYDGLRGKIKNVSQIDSIWNKDVSGEKDWRDSSDQYGWPAGYLSEMAAYSNEVRNLHMCSAILELAQKGKKVLITMGSSHAFRIEETLRHEFSKPQNKIFKENITLID